MTGEALPVSDPQLTPREAEVLELLGKGVSDQEIVDLLEISEAALERHLDQILDALGVRRRSEAIEFARSNLTTGLNPSGDHAVRSIAVLPFENLSADPEHEYFSDGLTDLLITELATLGGLRVVSRTSVARYKRASLPIREIARALDVDVIVEGTVQRIGNRVCVSVQLIDAGSDAHLWADRVERDVRDVLALQRGLALSIARHVHIDLSLRESARLQSGRRIEPGVLEDVLRAVHLMRQDRLDLQVRAVELMERVVKNAPDHAEGHVALAGALRGAAEAMNLPAATFKPRVDALVARGLELDPCLGAAFAVRGAARLQFDLDWAGAARDVSRGVELAPSEPAAMLSYGSVMSLCGRHDEAIVVCERACGAGATDSYAMTSLAWSLYVARRYHEAMQQLELAHRAEGHRSPRAELYRTWCHLALGRYTEARDIFLPDGSTEDSLSPSQAIMREAFAKIGVSPHDPVTPKAFAEMSRISYERQREQATPPLGLALHATAAGMLDEAIDALDRVFDAHGAYMMNLGVIPLLDPLREHPRFDALLDRVGWKAAVDAGVVFESARESAAESTTSPASAGGITSRPDAPVHPRPEGTVTVMFTDIVDFTAMTERLGDFRAREIVREHNRIVRDALSAHGGQELELMGDGFVLCFSGARPALQCAVEIQRSLERYNTRADEALSVRIGLHTGEVLVDDDGPFGLTVIRASRIAAQASGGEILVSALLNALTASGGDVSFGERRDLHLKGISGVQQVYAVGWHESAVSDP